MTFTSSCSPKKRNHTSYCYKAPSRSGICKPPTGRPPRSPQQLTGCEDSECLNRKKFLKAWSSGGSWTKPPTGTLLTGKRISLQVTKKQVF
ncbi:hypothetical protein LEMLEM_LOCUS23870 [Lemmus lemmus]